MPPGWAGPPSIPFLLAWRVSHLRAQLEVALMHLRLSQSGSQSWLTRSRSPHAEAPLEFPLGSYLIRMLQRAALWQWLTCGKTSKEVLRHSPWFLQVTGVTICFAGGHVLLAAAGATGVCLNLVQNAITSQEVFAVLADSCPARCHGMSRLYVGQAPAEQEGGTLRAAVCDFFPNELCRCTRAQCQGDPARRAGKQALGVSRNHSERTTKTKELEAAEAAEAEEVVEGSGTSPFGSEGRLLFDIPGPQEKRIHSRQASCWAGMFSCLACTGVMAVSM